MEQKTHLFWFKLKLVKIWSRFVSNEKECTDRSPSQCKLVCASFKNRFMNPLFPPDCQNHTQLQR